METVTDKVQGSFIKVSACLNSKREGSFGCEKGEHSLKNVSEVTNTLEFELLCIYYFKGCYHIS